MLCISLADEHNQADEHSLALKLFGHICRRYDNRLVKVVVFGMMDVEKQARKTKQGMD